MPAVTTAAIVLRRVNYRDNDRMLTLLSPGLGRLDVLARGCRRPKSPLMSACELFCLGEYVLLSRGERLLLTGCTLEESFYSLRLDISRLTCGAYVLDLCEAAAQPGEEAAELFRLLVRTLHRLTYGQEHPRGVLSAFLLHYAAILGYKPRLMHCVRCAKPLKEDTPVSFDCAGGGLCCRICDQKSPLLSKGQVRWLRGVFQQGPESSGEFPLEDAPFASLRCHVELRLERPVKSGALLDV